MPLVRYDINQPAAALMDMDPALAAARDVVNGDRYAVLHSTASNGIEVARIGDTMQLSDTGIGFISSFGNGLAPHNIVRAAFLHTYFKARGLRDSRGNPVPLYVLGAPGATSLKTLKKEELDRLSGGDMSILADKYLQAIKEENVGQVALAGASGGASIGMSAASRAAAQGMDVLWTAVTDQADVRRISRLKLGRGFLSQSDWSADVKGGGIDAFTAAAAEDNPGKYAANIQGAGKVNWAFFGAMTHNGLAISLPAALDVADVLLANGTRSKVSPPECVDAVADNVLIPDDRVLSLVRAEGSKHPWENNLPRLAHALGQVIRPAA